MIKISSRTALSALAFAVALGGLSACSKPATPAEEASASADAGAVAPVPGDNAAQDFVTKAAISNLFEIETSKLAQTQATNAQVKAFADQMIKDHTDATAKMQAALAQTSGLVAPTALDEPHQKMLDDLKGKTGADFDDAYVDAQKKAHDEAVSLFTAYSNDGADPVLKSFATATLPTLQAHKDHVEKLNP